MTTPSGGTGTPAAGGVAREEDQENAILVEHPAETEEASERASPVYRSGDAAERASPVDWRGDAAERASPVDWPGDAAERPSPVDWPGDAADMPRPVEQAAEAAERAQAVAADATERAQAVAASETLPRRVALERGRGVLAVAAAGVVGFGLIFSIVRLRWTTHFDLAVTRALQRLPVVGLPQLMAVVSWPGFPPQSRIIPFVLSGAIALLGFPLEALFQLLGWGTGLVSTVTKAIMKRPRPLEPDVRVVVARLGGSSFPSGHVITYMGVYGFLAYLVHTLVRPVAIRRTVVGFLTGLLALVGPSRIYQGHHWATDVLASYMLGLSYLIGLSAIYRRLKASLHPRLSDPPRS